MNRSSFACGIAALMLVTIAPSAFAGGSGGNCDLACAQAHAIKPPKGFERSYLHEVNLVASLPCDHPQSITHYNRLKRAIDKRLRAKHFGPSPNYYTWTANGQSLLLPDGSLVASGCPVG